MYQIEYNSSLSILLIYKEQHTCLAPSWSWERMHHASYEANINDEHLKRYELNELLKKHQ